MALLCACNASAAGTIKVQTLDGSSAMLSEFFEPQKWTLVMVWTTYCGVCREQYPKVAAFHDAHHDTDVKVVGISLDGFDRVDAVRAYIAERPQSFNSVIADLAEVASGYQRSTGEPFAGTPTYMLFSPQGELLGHIVGPTKMEAIEKFIVDEQS